MANMIVTIKVMPIGVDVNLEELQKKAAEVIKKFDGRIAKTDTQPVAFGLNALLITFLVDEQIPTTEPIEKEISDFDLVSSAEVTDMRRAVG